MEGFTELRNVLLTFTSFLRKIFLCIYIHLCVHVCMCMFGEGGCLQRSEERTGLPGTGITGGCEPPYVDAGSRTP